MSGVEETFLRLCLVADVARAEGGQRRLLDGGTLRPSVLVALAQEHGLLPAVHGVLTRLGAKDAWPALAELVAKAQARHGLWALEATRQLVLALDALTNAAVVALAFKGPVLGAQLFGSVASREFLDLDLLIHERSLERAVRALHPLGHRLSEELTPSVLRHEVMHHGRVNLWPASEAGFPVDLHLRLLPTLRGYARATDELLTRAKAVTVGGREVPTLALEDLAVFLCAHGAKHGWRRLGWARDFAALLAHPTLDWERAFDRAREVGARRFLTLGILFVHQLTGTALPPLVLPRLRKAPAVGRLAKALAAPRARLPLRLWEHAIFLAGMDGVRDRAAYVSSTLFSPTLEDVLRLTPRARALAPLTRGLRVAGKAGRALLLRAQPPYF
jgi:hypothetical protein